MKAVIVSDLHLGSDFFFCDAFTAWLDSLPKGISLVLNGDVIDDPGRALPACHRQVLSRLIEESFQRQVVWVYGNHDDGIHLEDAGEVTFAHHWEIGKKLLLMHGDDFDEVMPRNRWFTTLFRFFHRWRIRLGAHPVHVAQYAKKWKLLYRVLNESVMKNAIISAEEGGFEAVTCGHTHYPMNVVQNDIHYINTGAWTEKPLFYLSVGDNDIELREFSW